MNTSAYCDDCFTLVPREHADARKPCPKCGNTFYAIGIPSMQTPGATVYIEQRYEHLREYYNALEQIRAIRITGMTADAYAEYIEAGERNIALLQQAMDESCEQLRRAGLEPEIPPVIPMPIKLPDMYMRHGRWDDAQRVYDFCAAIPYLHELDFPKLKEECEENRQCATAIEELLVAGERSQKAIKKRLAERYSARALNFVLGYFAGVRREKTGTDFAVSLVEEKDRF